MTEKKLDRLEVEESGKVKKIEGERNLRQKLLDMGVIPGTFLKVVKVAPLGDPVGVEIRGYHLSLRKEEASKIIVEVE